MPTREERPASSVSKVQILNLRQGYALPSDDRPECVRVSVCEDIRPTRTAVPRLGCCFSFPSKQPQIVEIEGDRASKPAPASQSDFRLQCSTQHQHQHQQQRQPLRLSRAPFYSRCCSLAACAARAEQQRARPPPQQQRPTGSELHLSNSIPVQDHHPPRFAAFPYPHHPHHHNFTFPSSSPPPSTTTSASHLPLAASSRHQHRPGVGSLVSLSAPLALAFDLLAAFTLSIAPLHGFCYFQVCHRPLLIPFPVLFRYRGIRNHL